MDRPGLYVAGGIVLPALSMWASQLFLPEWQTGERADYISVLFAPELTAVFLPLSAFAASALAIRVGQLESRSFTMRLGLVTGVVLSLQYLGVIALSRPELAVWALAVFVPFVLFWLLRRSGLIGSVGVVMGTTIVPLFPMAMLGEFELNVWIYIACWIASLLAAAPLFSLMTYAYLLVCCRATPFGPSRLAVLPWLAACVGTWRFALARLDDVYRALPSTPPSGDCYVTTAAAHGHPRVVGSWYQQTRVVNRQMLVLKSAERVLQTEAPGVHRLARGVYDRIGPRLARRIRHPLLADVAYLLLKPCEWFGWGLVRCHYFIEAKGYDSSRPAPGSEP